MHYALLIMNYALLIMHYLIMTSFVTMSLTTPDFLPAFCIPSLICQCLQTFWASTFSLFSLQNRLPSYLYFFRAHDAQHCL